MPSRILVVDDFEPIRRYLCSMLEQHSDCQVIERAVDGLEAIEKAAAFQPDVVLLDMSLPKLNGIQAARQIRKVAPLARILFISVEFSFEMVDAALRLGAVGYLDKLCAGRDLLLAIDAIRGGRYFVSGVVRGGFGEATVEKPPIRHEVQLCSDDTVLRESFTDFAAATLEAHRAAIVVASESHRADVLDGLRRRGLDVDDAIREGTLVSLDATETLSSMTLDESLDPARLFNFASDLMETTAKAARREDGPSAAVCAECPPLLLAEGKMAQVLRLERLWSLIARTFRCDMLCGYALPDLEKDKGIFQSICGEHSAVHSR